MQLTFVSWNVDGIRGQAQPELLAGSIDWHLLALQEVRPAKLEAILAAAGLDASCGALSAPRLPPGSRDVDTPFFSALIARPPLRLTDVTELDVPSPRRTLSATVTGAGQDFAVASLALPPGKVWGTDKPRQAIAIASWLRERRRAMPAIIGIDGNTPLFERLSLADNEWWYPDEAVLLGAQRDHDLRDVYREHAEADPELWARIARERPDGPLAVSHRRGQGDRRVDCRYDAILASPEFRVRGAWYDLREGVSDHALVVAELDLAR
jgi:hypothetical protein